MRELLKGYRSTLAQYLGTAKGRHDVLDYGRALLIIFFVCAIVFFLLSFV